MIALALSGSRPIPGKADTMVHAADFAAESRDEGRGREEAGQASVAFRLIKRGNKGKTEATTISVPASAGLAARKSAATTEEERERSALKAATLAYAESSTQAGGGNVYMAEERMARNKNKKELIAFLQHRLRPHRVVRIGNAVGCLWEGFPEHVSSFLVQ